MATRWATTRRIKALGQKRQWQAALKILEVLQKWGGMWICWFARMCCWGWWNDPEKSDSHNENGKKKHEIKTSMIEHVMEADWGHYGTLMFSQFGWFAGVWVDKWHQMTGYDGEKGGANCTSFHCCNECMRRNLNVLRESKFRDVSFVETVF